MRHPWRMCKRIATAFFRFSCASSQKKWNCPVILCSQICGAWTCVLRCSHQISQTSHEFITLKLMCETSLADAQKDCKGIFQIHMCIEPKKKELSFGFWSLVTDAWTQIFVGTLVTCTTTRRSYQADGARAWLMSADVVQYHQYQQQQTALLGVPVHCMDAHARAGAAVAVGSSRASG